jgi:hypothetical protein
MTAADSSREAENAIRTLIQNWVVWRGSGQWERFRNVWRDADPAASAATSLAEGTIDHRLVERALA